MSIERIDHFVLTVSDIERSAAFYEALGLEIQTLGAGRTALRIGDQKINLHRAAGEAAAPKAANPKPGSGDFCLVTQDLRAVMARLAVAGLDIIEGPVPRTGAWGPIMSIYLADPDGNLVEIAEYDRG